jgi:formate hydrogenlyase transcriptional activator
MRNVSYRSPQLRNRAFASYRSFCRNDNGEDILDIKESSLSADFDNIIGASPAMQQIFKQLEIIARTDAAVLILGETGVGKSALAEAIYRRSPRREGPFICVQCSALTESLVTSELFGHEKGAFTGATGRNIGRFELANKGTLFLDEIGDLSLEVQARLLRVLQNKEFERVGGGKETLTSDFRLIAATNRNLEEEIKVGKFREDLYYRINVFPIQVPPLRERKEDIPLLVNHFLRKYAAQKELKNIPDEVMAELVQHEWPGNVCQLENVIQRGIVFGQGKRFILPPREIAGRTSHPTSFTTLREAEKLHILGALERTKWKIHGPGGAAELLDINSHTLHGRMRKLGIKRP